MKVHEKIRSLREEKNWSQEDMAKKLHMSVNGYSRIERGETKAYIPKLEKIAEALEVDLIELIPLEGKNVYLFNNNNSTGCHIFNSEAEVAFENEKLQLQLELKDKELAVKDKEITLQQREIDHLNEIIALLKTKTTE